jgi:predicted O-methyltransferase YrrM
VSAEFRSAATSTKSLEDINQLFYERPKFHESGSEHTCWGILREVAELIYQSIDENSVTLETGAGLSTLVFALRRSSHIAITPSNDEIESISEYAASHSITMNSVRFVNAASETYLPTAKIEKSLDLVLIDGRHAFPWPMIDYFYTAPKIKEGGLLLVDDVDLPSVDMLVRFLAVDTNWKLKKRFAHRTFVFEKIGNELNVEWNQQRYNLLNLPKPNLIKRITRKGRKLFRRLSMRNAD